jgi:hypothetical protein
MAIRANVGVDATATATCSPARAPAYENDIEEADVHHCMNTSWLLRRRDMNR